MHDGVCFFFEQVSERAEKGGAPVPVKRLLARVLGALLIGKWAASFLDCVRGRLCETGIRVLDESVAVVLLKSGFLSGEFCSSLHDYGESLNVPGA